MPNIEWKCLKAVVKPPCCYQQQQQLEMMCLGVNSSSSLHQLSVAPVSSPVSPIKMETKLRQFQKFGFG